MGFCERYDAILKRKWKLYDSWRQKASRVIGTCGGLGPKQGCLLDAVPVV